MAGYSIVLNLNGNAVSRAEKLATALGTAAANATSLAAALRAVGSAGASVPARTIRVGTAGTGSYRSGAGGAYVDHRFREYIQGMTRQSDALRQMSRYYRDLERSSRSYARTQEQVVRRTRHRSTRILSYGTGFNVGGLSGRFSTILQPDASGNILGMNAERLMSGLNMAALGASVAKSVATFMVKNMVRATVGQFAVGGAGTMLMSRFLMSESMAQGVRIIQRRNQARLGLGMSSYVEANQRADELAQNYGLERSVALSSINVLTGMGSTGGKRLTMGGAAALTRVGGLISQQAGVPFERVMTNFQQILSQDKPNIRDIRELLNQAPILKRYALDEISKRGEKIDANSWLKDKSNFLNVLSRYDVENSSSMIMQARGMVSVAQQDMIADLAQNSSWMNVAMNASSLITTFGKSLSELITSLNNDTGFRNSVNALIELMKYASENSDKITSTVSRIAAIYADYFGIDVAEAKSRGAVRTQRQQTVEYALEQDKERIRQAWLASDRPIGDDPALLNEQFETYFKTFKARTVRDDDVLVNVEAMSKLRSNDLPWFMPSRWLYELNAGREASNNQFRTGVATLYFQRQGGYHVLPAPAGSTAHPQSAYGAMAIRPEYYMDRLHNDLLTPNTDIPTDLSTGGANDPYGTNLSGFNNDRRSLTINFNDAIVKWDSVIETNDPQEVVNEVRENIDQITSEAIQKALLASTGKLISRGY